MKRCKYTPKTLVDLPDELLLRCLVLAARRGNVVRSLQSFARYQLLCSRIKEVIEHRAQIQWQTAHISPEFCDEEELGHYINWLIDHYPNNLVRRIEAKMQSWNDDRASVHHLCMLCNCFSDTVDTLVLQVDNLDQKDNRQMSQQFEAALYKLSYLKSMAIEVSTRLSLQLPHIPSLERMCLKLPRDATTRAAAYILANQTSLRSLFLTCFGWVPERGGCEPFGGFLERFEALRELSLRVGVVGLSILFSGASKPFEVLKNLHIGVLAQQKNLDTLHQVFPQLEQLTLAIGTPLSSSLLYDGSRMRFKNLKALELQHVRIGDSAEMLAPLTALQSLSLRHCEVRYCDGLSSMAALEDLELVENSVVHSLRGIESLKKLRIVVCSARILDLEALGYLPAVDKLQLLDSGTCVRNIPWSKKAFTQSIRGLVISSSLCVKKGSFPKLEALSITGNGPDDVGSFTEAVIESGAHLRYAEWTGYISVCGMKFAVDYPRAAWHFVYRNPHDVARYGRESRFLLQESEV